MTYYYYQSLCHDKMKIDITSTLIQVMVLLVRIISFLKTTLIFIVPVLSQATFAFPSEVVVFGPYWQYFIDILWYNIRIRIVNFCHNLRTQLQPCPSCLFEWNYICCNKFQLFCDLRACFSNSSMQRSSCAWTCVILSMIRYSNILIGSYWTKRSMVDCSWNIFVIRIHLLSSDYCLQPYCSAHLQKEFSFRL